MDLPRYHWHHSAPAYLFRLNHSLGESGWPSLQKLSRIYYRRVLRVRNRVQQASTASTCLEARPPQDEQCEPVTWAVGTFNFPSALALAAAVSEPAPPANSPLSESKTTDTQPLCAQAAATHRSPVEVSHAPTAIALALSWLPAVPQPPALPVNRETAIATKSFLSTVAAGNGTSLADEAANPAHGHHWATPP